MGVLQAPSPGALSSEVPVVRSSAGGFNNYDRCITRGLAGSWLPVVYGNGARIMQTPDAVIIAYEMVHDTRIYEYRCHEGNGAVKYSLSGERAYEREAAENAAKGLPPPERVFERVNGADRGR